MRGGSDCIEENFLVKFQFHINYMELFETVVV
jgi:hypothetical protein